MPRGILSVTVPGGVWGWGGARALRHAHLQAGARARRAVCRGRLSRLRAHRQRLACCPMRCRCRGLLHASSIRIRSRPGIINGRPPEAGQMFKNPDLARTFRCCEAHGADVFLQGRDRAGDRRQVERAGRHHDARGSGQLSRRVGRAGADRTITAMTSASCRRPHRLGPPMRCSTSWQACVPAMGYRARPRLARARAIAQYWHLLVEAKKLAYADLYRYNGDPDFIPVPLGKLLSKSHAGIAHAARSIQQHASTHRTCRGNAPSCPATPSCFRPPTAGQHGVLGQQQLRQFRLGHHRSRATASCCTTAAPCSRSIPTARMRSPPHKRPFNTLVGRLRHAARLNGQVMTVTLMGGDMQAQGHAQLLVDVLDLGANLQAADGYGPIPSLPDSRTRAASNLLYNAVDRSSPPWTTGAVGNRRGHGWPRR